MGFSNTNSLSYVRNYEEAEKHFERTPLPRTRGWEPHQRPLDTHKGGQRKWHYRLENHNNRFDVCLYHTCMASFYKPEGDTRVVGYHGDVRATSQLFMRNVLDIGRRLERVTTEGVTVSISVANDHTTRLVLVGDKVDTRLSFHPVMGTWRMSDEKKAACKEMRKAIRASGAWLAVELRYQTFCLEADYRKKWGKLHACPGDEGWLMAVVEYAQLHFNSMVGWGRQMPEQKAFMSSLMKSIISQMKLDEKDEFVELPLFMPVTEYPVSALVKPSWIS